MKVLHKLGIYERLPRIRQVLRVHVALDLAERGRQPYQLEPSAAALLEVSTASEYSPALRNMYARKPGARRCRYLPAAPRLDPGSYALRIT